MEFATSSPPAAPDRVWAVLRECFASCCVPLVHTDVVKSLQTLNAAIRRRDSRCHELSQRLNAASAQLRTYRQVIRQNEELECSNVDLASTNTLLTLSNARLQKIIKKSELESTVHMRGTRSDTDARIVELETKLALAQDLAKGIEKINLSLQHKRNSAQCLDRQLKVSYNTIKSLRSIKPSGWQAKLCHLRSKHRQLMEQARSRQRDIQHEEVQLQRCIQSYLEKR